MAKGKLPKEMKKKVEEWKFNSGAVIMCMVAYYDGKQVQSFQFVNASPNGWQVSYLISSVESSPVAGNKFTNSCDEWRDGTYDNFNQWAVRQFGIEELDSNDEAEVPADLQKAKDMVFEKNGRGEFILPSMVKCQNTKQRQRLIRGYIGAVYRESTHSLYIYIFLL